MMSRNAIISGVILSSIVILHTGCFSRVSVEDKADARVQKQSEETTQVVHRNNRNYRNSDVECNDDLTSDKSDCDVGIISKDKLKNRAENFEQHTLTSIRGKTIHINERSNGFTFPEYKNKVIILEMFGKDCSHCIKEIPVIEKIRSRYRGKLEVIAVQSQGRMDRATAKAYINGHRIRYPIIEGDDANNLKYFIQKTYSWTGILPYTLVIKDGVTEFAYSGEFDYKDIKRDIDSLF